MSADSQESGAPKAETDHRECGCLQCQEEAEDLRIANEATAIDAAYDRWRDAEYPIGAKASSLMNTLQRFNAAVAEVDLGIERCPACGQPVPIAGPGHGVNVGLPSEKWPCNPALVLGRYGAFEPRSLGARVDKEA